MMGLFTLWFRVTTFGAVPAELNRDEAAILYNAWSLSKEGIDEWGASWPIVFRSFGDFKLGGYIYAVMSSIWVFGEHDWVVRFPSLIATVLVAGGAGVIGWWFTRSRLAALLSLSIVLASPWQLHYGNVGFEANLALGVFLWSICSLYRSQRHLLWYVLGVILMVLAIFTYNTPFLLLPFVGLGLFVLRKVSFAQVSGLAVVFLVSTVLLWPAIGGKTGISIFTDQGLELQRQEFRTQDTSFFNRVRTNPAVYWPTMMLVNGAKHFTPNFLVLRGGPNPWHQAPSTGHLVWPIYLLSLFGIGSLIISCFKEQGVSLRRNLTILLAIVFSLLPAVITVDAPHATRTLVFLTLLGVLAGSVLIRLLRIPRYGFPLGGAIMILIVGYTGWYGLNYTKLMTILPQAEWKVGYSSALRSLPENQSVAIVGDPRYDYVHVLWVFRIPASEFLNTVERGGENLGYPVVQSIGSRFLFVSNKDAVPSAMKSDLRTIERVDRSVRLSPAEEVVDSVAPVEQKLLQ